jgi:hypothetical protein
MSVNVVDGIQYNAVQKQLKCNGTHREGIVLYS